jgi:hypothetical protein
VVIAGDYQIIVGKMNKWGTDGILQQWIMKERILYGNAIRDLQEDILEAKQLLARCYRLVCGRLLCLRVLKSM